MKKDEKYYLEKIKSSKNKWIKQFFKEKLKELLNKKYGDRNKL